MKQLLMALAFLALLAAPAAGQACGADKQASAKSACEGSNCAAKPLTRVAKSDTPSVAKTTPPPCEGQGCATRQDKPKAAAVVNR